VTTQRMNQWPIRSTPAVIPQKQFTLREL